MEHNVKTDFGAIGDGITDDTAVINSAIASINAGSVKSLYFPSGTYLISATLTTLTASDWAITGAGMGASTITMSSTAGSAGTVFTLGTATNAARWSVSGFDIRFNNSTSLNGVGNPIVINGSADGMLSRIRVVGGNGFVTLGSTALGGMCSRQVLEFCRASAHAPAGGKMVDIQAQAGLKMHGCSFGATGIAATGFRGMLVHPTATDTMDNMKVSSSEWNFPNSDVQYTVEFDLTNNTSATQVFTNCVFDQAIGSNIYAHIDAGAIPDARFSASFTGCTSNGTTGAIPILLDNTGGKDMSIRWTGGHISTGDAGSLVKITGGHNVDARFDTTELVSRAPSTSKPAFIVGPGCSGLSIQGCSAVANVSSVTGLPFVPFTNLVEFQGAASNCTILGNNATDCLGDLVKWAAIPTTGLESVIIRDNLAPHSKFPYTKSLSTSTPTIIYTYPLSDETSYAIKAKVHAQNAAGSNRAYYEYTGLFYRDGGGPATLQGAIVTGAAIESDPAWNCALGVSGNNVNLTVTGTSGVGIEWMFDVEVTKNTK